MLSSAHPHPYKNRSIALIGYGVTGKACVQFLLEKGAKVSVFDKSFKSYSAETENLALYPLDESASLAQYDYVVVSPGVNLQQAFIRNYKNSENVIGDIELFARELKRQNDLKKAPQKHTKVIAVTGSNGKSTVVDMLTKALTKAGLRVALGGNFGTSALSLLTQEYDLFVLELSSFQLESTYSLHADVACILNVTSDHLDRHGNIENYTQIKHRIYKNAKHVIFNRDDELTAPEGSKTSYSIGLHKSLKPEVGHHYYQTDEGIFCGNNKLINKSSLNSNCQFQLLNMQVVLACTHILGLEYAPVVSALASYTGLPHRYELICRTRHVDWINDSKATNPGACLAAIESASSSYEYIILIAGGDAKGADASILTKAIQQNVDMMYLMGKDAELFTQFEIPYQYTISLQDAVNKANEHVKKLLDEAADSHVPNRPTIAVLLSPACASIDMFQNYQQRGDIFSQAVHQQVAA